MLSNILSAHNNNINLRLQWFRGNARASPLPLKHVVIYNIFFD